jgi:hypothetical protein
MSLTRRDRASRHPTERLEPEVAPLDQNPDVGNVATSPMHPSAPVERDTLPLGTLAGEYELKTTLGRGAFGTVYCAVHRVIGKEVAVKVLDGLGVEDVERRFLAEARAVNRINHPNIVDIFGFGELETGQKFYVMELLKGETLRAFCHRFGALPWRMALDVLTPLADALDAAHRVGVLHRDLKPANVFLHHHPSGSVVVKLLDFGIAKSLVGEETGVTSTGSVIGTPAYMAPERWWGGPSATASDIYSLGVIAYEMLTGRRPFTGSKAREIIAHQRRELPILPSSLNPLLPLTVDEPLLAMLNRDPAARPTRARVAIAALKNALDGASENPRHRLGEEAPTMVRTQPPTGAPAARDSMRLAVAAAPGPTCASEGPPSPRRWGAFLAAAVIASLAVAALSVGWLVRARPLEAERAIATPQPQTIVSPPSAAPQDSQRGAAPAPVAAPQPAPEAGKVAISIEGAGRDSMLYLDDKPLGKIDQPHWVPRSIGAIRLRVVEREAGAQSSKVVPHRKRAVAPAPRRPIAGSASAMAPAPRRPVAAPAPSTKPLSLAAQELEF